MPDATPTLVCNLDPRGTRLRGTIGLVFAVVTLVALVLVALGSLPGWWRLLVFPPAYGAAVGLLQARAKT